MRMQRNNNNSAESSIPLFSGWEQKVYYDIKEKNLSIIGKLLMKNTNQIIIENKLINLEQVISILTEKCLLKLYYDCDDDEN